MTTLSVTNSTIDYALILYYSNPRLILILSFGIVFILYYLADVAKQPILACQEGKFKKFLQENCPILQQRYWPTLWCFGTHAQTALANFLRGWLPDLPYHRELIKLPDGGIVSLDWLESYVNHGNSGNQPVALFLPGLTGHSQTEYVKSLVPVAQKLGCKCVVFNNRGRGGVALLTPKTYCAVNTGDLREVLKYIQKKYPNSAIFGTGISLGGIILGQYLVESGDKAVISAAMLISVPWDVHAGAASIEIPGLNLMLNKHLARSLCNMVRPYKEKFEKTDVNMESVLQSRTIREFDDRFTTKIFGFNSVDEYYQLSSLRGRLHGIKRPVLCVNAADDMFAPFYTLPHQEASQSSHVAMVITSRGGHIGFMEGFLPIAPFFSERLYEQYLRSLLKLYKEGKIKNLLC
ncbi:phospholipase ABHD3-like [Centruroides sculpturatus]|uniref:phospholipase ABHD3-like n=1 Tax=Centruroides sculpturatus TaxID=218467 RepID=UPI000C6D7A03|nr:phospholipase ABHD3-like [Centruroides sculpturatus]